MTYTKQELVTFFETSTNANMGAVRRASKEQLAEALKSKKGGWEAFLQAQAQIREMITLETAIRGMKKDLGIC